MHNLLTCYRVMKLRIKKCDNLTWLLNINQQTIRYSHIKETNDTNENCKMVSTVSESLINANRKCLELLDDMNKKFLQCFVTKKIYDFLHWLNYTSPAFNLNCIIITP